MKNFKIPTETSVTGKEPNDKNMPEQNTGMNGQ